MQGLTGDCPCIHIADIGCLPPQAQAPPAAPRQQRRRRVNAGRAVCNRHSSQEVRFLAVAEPLQLLGRRATARRWCPGGLDLHLTTALNDDDGDDFDASLTCRRSLQKAALAGASLDAWRLAVLVPAGAGPEWQRPRLQVCLTHCLSSCIQLCLPHAPPAGASPRPVGLSEHGVTSLFFVPCCRRRSRKWSGRWC